MIKNKGIAHIIIILVGIGIILLMLGFFNSVQKNWEIQQTFQPKI